MSCLQDIATVECAVKVCNKYSLKREILCASGSDYELKIKSSDESSPIEVWNEIVEQKAAEELKALPKILIREVMKFVFPIGIRMLTWAMYHERTIGFSRDFSIDILEPAFFTQEGLVDKRRVAEKLMEEESLSRQQKYMLACLYCFEDNIKDLCRQMTTEERGSLRIARSGLMKFWTYYSRGEADNLRGRKPMDEYRLEKAVESGSKAAVEYSWNIIPSSDSSLKDEYIQNVAIHAVRNSVRHSLNDCVIFQRRGFYGSWVPSTYYFDIIYFLLSEMTEHQKREFLERDTNTDYTEVSDEFTKRSMVLEYSLSWPYQVHFMETARLMWEFLPENNYADLLLKICDKIGLGNRQDVQHDEGTFDYRQLFQEFWKKSPQRYRKYVLSNAKVDCLINRQSTVKSGTGLLTRLLTLHCYSAQDDKAIRLILKEATDTEKENIFSDKAVGYTCVELAKQEKWYQLNTLLLSFASIVEENKFKSEFFRDWRGQLVFSDSLKSGKLNAFKEFAVWCALPEEKLKEFKKELMKSESVVFSFRNFLLKERKMNIADEVLMWCLSSEDEIKMYKKDLISLHTSELHNECFLSQEKTNLIDEFANWCLPSGEEIQRLKKKVFNERGGSICQELFHKIYSEKGTNFESGQWKRMDNLFNWCLLTEQDIRAFKRNTILGELSERIVSYFIKSNRYKEAENFFTWLGLSTEEIKILKDKTIRTYARSLMGSAETCNEVHISICNSASVERRRAMQVSWGFDWAREETELFLKFCLTEKEAAIKFKEEFKEEFANQRILELQVVVLENLCEMVDKHSKDIEKETGVKRKFETLSP